MSKGQFYPVAMTIAGSDSSGGAGIQADLRTFSAFGVYGCSAITAVTAQNPGKVSGVTVLQADFVREQLETVCDAIQVAAFKTGMLAETSVVEAVAEALARHQGTVVVDPVMIATSGARLLSEDAVAAIKEKLLPRADWMTPNLSEAEVLTGRKIASLADMADAAQFCGEHWQCSCIVKGGHLTSDDDTMVDIVWHEGKLFRLSSPVAEGRHSHGTGCTLSAALAACFSLDMSWKKSLCAAKGFVYGSLLDVVPLGQDVEAMYPPMDSHLDKIKLKRYGV